MTINAKIIKQQLAQLPRAHLLGVGKELRELPNLLDEGEVIIGLIRMFTDLPTTVLLCATDKRLFIIDRHPIGRSNKELSYLQIANVRYDTALILGSLDIDDQGEDHHFVWGLKKEVAQFANLLGDKINEYRQKMVNRNQAANNALNVAAEIDQLWQLKEKGAITQDEFVAQKNKLLDQS